jgi:hypothetical protein
MNEEASRLNTNFLPEPSDFSLVLGGPLFQLLRRSHLSGDALELWRQRILIITLVAWAPLLALSALEGQALGGRAAVPFLLDVEAHGVMLAGPVANRILYLGAALPEFKVEIAILVIFLLCLVLGPLLLFAPQLAQAKRIGNREYGALAARYVREFDAKWLRSRASANEPLVGSADIQSLADLATSFEVVRRMQIAPITSRVLKKASCRLLKKIQRRGARKIDERRRTYSTSQRGD